MKENYSKIGESQIKLLNLSRNYCANASSFGVDVAESSLCCLVNVPGVPSYFILKQIQENKKIGIKSIYCMLKNFVSASILHNYKLFNNNINLEKNFERLIISFAKKDDFEIDGSYTDRYFSVNSRHDLRTLWFLLYVDDSIPIPKNIDKNIVIFGKANIKKKYNFFYLIKVLLKTIKQCKGSLIKIFHLCSRSSHLAKIISKAVIEIVKVRKFKTVLIAYEAQPFQNTIFKEIRKISSDIKLIGYLHSTQSLPTFLIHRYGAPDLLLVHGSTQIYHLNKYLNWPAEKLRLIPSLRYNKKDKFFFSNTLVLPISISFEETLIKQLKFFLDGVEEHSLKPFVIKNHPFAIEPKIEKRFINNLKKVLLEYSNRFSNKAEKDVSVFFGGSSSILEALENGLTVIHICGDMILESYTEALWPSIKVRQINENMLTYSLRSYGKCINFGVGNNSFEKHCNL